MDWNKQKSCVHLKTMPLIPLQMLIMSRKRPIISRGTEIYAICVKLGRLLCNSNGKYFHAECVLPDRRDDGVRQAVLSLLQPRVPALCG